jgi:hypothetical protein
MILMKRTFRTVLVGIGIFFLILGCGGGGDAAPFQRNLGTKATAFGDSITLGYNASADQYRYANIIARKVGWTLTNRAQSGSQLADEIPVIYAETVAADGNSFLLTGFNDMRNFGTDNGGMTYYQDALYAALAWLSVPDGDKIKGAGDNVVFNGTWDISPFFNRTGRRSSQQGATAEFSVSGTVVYIASVSYYGGTGTFRVTVDGTEVGTYTCSTNIKPASQAAYAPFLIRLTGLPDGSHTVIITVTSASGNVSFDWAAGVGVAAKAGPNVFVGNTLRMRPAGYGAAGPISNHGSDQAVAAINARIRAVCDDLARDGRNVVHVDACAVYDPMTSDISTMDEMHPSDQGMAKIAAAFLAAMQ